MSTRDLTEAIRAAAVGDMPADCSPLLSMVGVYSPVHIWRIPAWNISTEAFVLIYFAAFYADVPADRDRKTVSEINFQ